MKYLTNYNSMNVAEGKGKVSFFQTRTFSGENWFEKTNEKYVRGSLKGQFKTKKHPIYKSIYSHIKDAWKDQSDWRQTSTGLWHSVRNVIVCDYDGTDFDEKISYWNNTCNSIGLPIPSYYTQNLESKHGQFGWFIEQVDNKSSKYINLTHALASVFGTDMNFCGWNIKNPCYNETNNLMSSSIQKTTWNSDEMLDINDIEDALGKIHPINKESKKNNCYITTSTAIAYTPKANNTENSRNYYLRHNLIIKIFEFMRHNNSERPSETDILSWADNISSDAGVITGKGKQSDIEIKRVAISCSNWAIRNFRSISKGCSYDKSQQELSQRVKICNKYLRYSNVMKYQNLSLRECAHITGYSFKTVANYRNMNELEVKKMVMVVKEFIRYIDNDKVKETSYYDLYNALTSCVYYSNTTYTPIMNSTENTIKYMESRPKLPNETDTDKVFTQKQRLDIDRFFRYWKYNKNMGKTLGEMLSSYYIQFNEDEKTYIHQMCCVA